MAAQYGVTVPMADLLYADVATVLTQGATAGHYVGLHSVGKYRCHHLAFAMDTLDWEIWVQQGDPPLPRKLVITYKQRPGTPRYQATFTRWELSHAHEPGWFDFRVPSGAKEIQMTPMIDETRFPASLPGP